MKLLIIACGLLLLSTSAWSAKFPPNVNKCPAGDSACIMKVAMEVLAASKGGNPGLGLPAIDPLKIERINIQEGSGGPVNINLFFQNVTLSGLSSLDVYLMNGWDKQITTPKAMKARLLNGQKLTIEGDYRIAGRVLLLPINGEGKCKLDFHGWDSDWKLTAKATTKNNKDYMVVDKSKLEFKATKLTMNFENLFNGDKQLSETMNSFLNDNWSEILNELRPSLSDTISQILISLVSGTFSRIPYNEIFSD